MSKSEIIKQLWHINHTGSAPKIVSRQRDLVEALRGHVGRHRLFHVPVWVNKDRTIGKEFTHRSRSFLYAALGFVVARIFGLSRLRFFENGVVSLNLPIVPHELGARASRTTHPRVINGFSKLFSGLAQTLYKLDLLVSDLPPGEARTMVEAYVRTVSEIERMNDIAFFSRFGEASRAVRFIPEGANAAGQKIFDLYKRHAVSVCGVVDDGIRKHASALRAHTLPAGSLLVLALPRRDDADTFVSSRPLTDLAQQEFEDEQAAARSRPNIRIAFDEKKRRVIFKTWPPLSGASYSILDQLRAEYEQAKQAGLAPENYPFVNSHKLAQILEVDEPTVRARISRLRRRLDKHAIAAGNGPLSPDAVIENEPWSGYRLNPAVLVLAVSELCQNNGVTSPKG